MVGRAMFTTDPSMNAMLDPRIVAASVRRLRFSDRPEGKTGVAPMIPASQGGRVKPTIRGLAGAKLDTNKAWIKPPQSRFCLKGSVQRILPSPQNRRVSITFASRLGCLQRVSLLVPGPG